MSEPSPPAPDELHAQVQHRLIQKIEETEQRLRDLLENLPEVVVQCDPDGTVTYLNNAWSILLGYEVDTSIGLPLPSFLAEEDRASWPGFPAAGEDDRRVQIRFQTRAEEVRWFRVILRTTEQGQCTGLLHDVTDRVELEAQLRQAQKMEAIGRLAGGVAHDFNNLLTVIIGTCDTLLETLPERESDSRSDLHTVLGAAERAAVLTRQLLAFGRRQTMRYRVVHLAEVIDEMEVMLERLIDPSIEIVVEDLSEECRVRADPVHLQQVIMNLSMNARDAMPGGGLLRFEITDVESPPGFAPGPWILLTVSDTGCGIPGEHLDRIFEPFFTTKAAGEGTGLGLATTYGIITQSGGTITVDSTPGSGTTFRIHLPSAPAEVETEAPGSAGAAETPELPPAASGTETILVVEDEEAVRLLTARALASRGYTVLEAERISEAYEHIEEQHGQVDLVLTDLVMPGGSGRDLVQYLCAEWPDIRLIVMSGYEEGAQGEWEHGIAFLPKPFLPSTLLAKVREVFDA